VSRDRRFVVHLVPHLSSRLLHLQIHTACVGKLPAHQGLALHLRAPLEESLEARGDILLALESGMLVVDVSVMTPGE
jgi:hypothetical protein